MPGLSHHARRDSVSMGCKSVDVVFQTVTQTKRSLMVFEEVSLLAVGRAYVNIHMPRVTSAYPDGPSEFTVITATIGAKL